MTRFLAGFATASALWGGVLAVLFLSGAFAFAPEEEVAIENEEEVVAIDDAGAQAPRRRRRRRRGSEDEREARHAPSGNATTGDDLGQDDPRVIDGEGVGGEAQLSHAQIDEAVGAAFGRVRRCLVLAAGDDPVTGQLTFGLRIAGSGAVTRVNLSGPAAVTTGESGDCLRQVARSIDFPSFDGPDMFVRYPVSLE